MTDLQFHPENMQYELKELETKNMLKIYYYAHTQRDPFHGYKYVRGTHEPNETAPNGQSWENSNHKIKSQILYYNPRE